MDSWYYATADGQRHGPLQAEQLRALAVSGAINAQTLVWREGLAQWQPLHLLAAELRLDTLPPPMAAAPVAPPPRSSGMSGCLIALLVGVVGMFLLAILGILAAIALPAYNDYRLRAHASAAIAQAQAQQPAVTAFLAAHERCPENGDEGFGEADDYADTHLSSIVFGEFEGSDYCGLEATISAPDMDDLDGSVIWLEYDADAGTWECTSDVPDSRLPLFCRG